MNKLLIVLLVLISTVAVSGCDRRPQVPRDAIVGEYRYQLGHGSDALTLQEDGMYEQVSTFTSADYATPSSSFLSLPGASFANSGQWNYVNTSEGTKVVLDKAIDVLFTDVMVSEPLRTTIELEASTGGEGPGAVNLVRRSVDTTVLLKKIPSSSPSAPTGTEGPHLPSTQAVGASETAKGWQVIAGDHSALGSLDGPCGIAVDSHDNVYVADTWNHRILKLSSDGQPLSRWGSVGKAPGQFNWPRAVAVDALGNVYVADGGNNRIQKLSPDGQPLAEWGGTRGMEPGQFDGPFGLAVDRLGDIYVAEGVGHRIQKISPSRQPISQWITKPGQFVWPQSVTLDSKGDVYVTDTGKHRLQKLSPDGQSLVQWGGQGSGPGQFLLPKGIAVDGQGNLYVADSWNHRILKLSSDGQPLAKWGKQGTGLGEFDTPAGIAVDGQGNVYVADTGNNRIQKLSQSQ